MTAPWDIIVVGAGTAGMPLCIEAAARGARVLALEHAPEVGGTLHVAAGQISAAGTSLQRQKGIDDDPQRHVDDVLRISNGTADEAMVRLVAENAPDTFEWLCDLGFTPLPEHPVLFGQNPYSVPRTYWGAENGRTILKAIRPPFDAAVARGAIEVKVNTEVTDLMTDTAGAVIGVRARQGNDQVEFFAANIVLTSGGYGASKERFPKFTDGYPAFGWARKWSQGGATEAALSAGAVMQNQDFFLPKWAGVENPTDPTRTERYTETNPDRRPPWEIYVDGTGRRFMAEDLPEAETREEKLMGIPDLTFWVIYDEGVREAAPPLFDKLTDAELDQVFGHHPSYCRASSVADLAVQTGLDATALEASVAQYNAAVRAGSDPMGRQHLPCPIETPPFYAVRHHGVGAVTIPGLAVDESLRVTRPDGTPIPNLYAAGEILGLGLHSGRAFVGGMGIMPALTYGRLLGRRLLQWSHNDAAAE